MLVSSLRLPTYAPLGCPEISPVIMVARSTDLIERMLIAQEAAAAAKREAHAAADVASQSEARAAVFEAARATEQRKCAALQADLTALADDSDAKVGGTSLQ